MMYFALKAIRILQTRINELIGTASTNLWSPKPVPINRDLDT